VNVTIKDLLEAGVHFGHQTRRWDPKMKPYIFKEQSGIYILNLHKTIEQLEKTYRFIADLAAEGKTVLFVGTKRQAKESVRDDARRCDMFYVNERWLGGTLTNFKTIRQSMDRLEDMEKMEEDGRIEQLSKKERLSVEKQKKKLLKVLSGIRGMDKLPACLIIIDTKKEAIAIREARKLGIPLIGLVDTNSNPEEVDFPIPANDDAIRSIKLFTRVLADAVMEGRAKYTKGKEFLEEKSKAKDAASKRAERPRGRPTGETKRNDMDAKDENKSIN
jgi:small subunit ribosomal protein S2